MEKSEMLKLLEGEPVIAAVKDEEGLYKCLTCPAGVVFVLFGTVVSIPGIVEKLHRAGKAAVVHVDLIDGLALKESAVEYIAQATKAQGVISTRPALVQHALHKGLIGIRRLFLLDSLALENLHKQVSPENTDFLEVLPGAMPKVLQKIAKGLPVPMIAGGLIADKEDVVNALSAGAVAVSTTNPEVWKL
ncbi:MAG: glycerol-3-phosphate responsive antiterminator [Oscillospiraceae bacterium]